MKQLHLVFGLLLVSLLLAGEGARPAYAAAYIVNSLEDNTTDDSACTLREAILAADNLPANTNCGTGSTGNDTITFSVSGTITLGSVLPNIMSGVGTLTIDGGKNITISGNNNGRVMIVDSGADLILQNLTITEANTPISGGGVANFGALTVIDSTFSNNIAGSGGGIVNLSSGTVTVINSVFTDNQANTGGGIDNAGGLMTVINSTFTGNRATITHGGGIRNSGMLTVINSTFTGNGATDSSSGEGGGIWNDGTLLINNSTFFGNFANPSPGGGNIRINSGSATIKNTIIAGSVNGGDCVGVLSDTSNNNLISHFHITACNLTNGSNGNIIGQNPNLGALTGSPAYFPLNAGSPALNAGDNASCSATDQRDVPRPQGGRCDIGAFEVVFVSLPLIVR
ncbi:MAG: hypothetical protein OHK0015_32870 [Chloroflexi bacterium OHK40]